MKNYEKTITSFNLPCNWDKYDLAYEYSKNSIKKLYNGHYEKNQLKTVIFDYFLNCKHKIDFNFITSQLLEDTKNYFILSKKFKKIDEINNLKNIEHKLTFYFETITNALLLARNKDDYIIEIQFNLIEWFLYAIWFMNSPKNSIKLFEKILSESFRYPNVDFQKQHEVCCKTAQKSYIEQQNPENLLVLLENIYKHFIFNIKILNKWEKQILSKTKNNFYIVGLKNKIYEWILIHYLLPLYVIVHGYKEKDTKFKLISEKLYYYNIDNQILIDVINLMINTQNIVNELNDKKIQKLYETVRNECEKIICKNLLFKKRS
ncbi:hypothetical protein [Mycoplasmoides pirum]|uniref:hypothetical protein n=1 Tax=Mycoplasmoides pirum TaxID=2122 RepID=UPI0004801BD0|nr:hypothetical protein [Mycoplasmoides pirum]